MQRLAAVLAVVGLAAAAPPARAQEAAPVESEPTRVDVDRHTQLGGRVGFEGPLGAAASLRLIRGLGADVREPDGRAKVVCAAPLARCARGFVLEAAAGSGGGRLGLGLGARVRAEDEDFHGSVGAGVKASLVRTWGHPVGTEAGLTYLGPELDLAVARLDLTLGVLWQVSGQGGAASLFSWGLGLGF